MGPDTLDSGRYRIVSVLGRSDYAVVHEAHDTKRGDRVAVKVLSVAGGNKKIAEAMFHKEVAALDGLAHPAIVQLLGHFVDDTERAFGIALELVPGGRTLAQLITDVAGGREPRRQLRWRLSQLSSLADALGAAHHRSVIHRDIKPANVLHDRDMDTLKLADFGIARLLESYARGKPGTTLREFYSRPYAAPEQVLHGDAGFPADIHAFALTSASLLAWSAPDESFKRDHLEHLLAPLKTEILDAALYDRLFAAHYRALADDPRERPRLSEFAALFRELLERTADRRQVPIRVTNSARKKATDAGCRNDAALLDDFSDSLRARYQTDRDRSGGESFAVRVFGRRLYGVLRPDERESEKLVLVDVGQNPPAIHAQHREGAEAAPFMLTVGDGTAGPLIAHLFGLHEEKRRKEEDRRKKESLLAVASFVIARQRERLLDLRIRYRLHEGTKPRSDFAEKLLKATGATRAADPRELVDSGTDLLALDVHAVFPVDEEATGADPEPLGDDWAVGLDDKCAFTFDGVRFATFHGYDRKEHRLHLRVEKRRKLPREGELGCKDIPLEAALKRQENAIDHLLHDDCVNPRLGRLLLFPEDNAIADVRPRTLLQNLAPQAVMRSLVERAAAANDFFLIQGPPGTGKTTLIAEIIAQLLTEKPDIRVLLTSQSNEAVDNALDALADLNQAHGKNWRMLRDVSDASRENMLGFDSQFGAWVSRTRAKSIDASKSLDSSLAPDRAKAAGDVLARWRARIDRTDDVRQDYAEAVQVFGVTCLRVPTLWRLLRDVRFDWVIVDEAARATPAEVLVSLVCGKRFVMVGDHRQLPPFLHTEVEEDLRDKGFDLERAKRSLFEEIFQKLPLDNRQSLTTQFRMHKTIGDFVGGLFYEDIGGLATGVADVDRTLAVSNFGSDHRVKWFDVSGEDRRDGTSYFNEAEVDVVERLLRRFDDELSKASTTYTVAVIAPYAAQVERLRSKLRPSSKAWRSLVLKVDTVDAFQGRQADVVLYSLVRVGPGQKKFLADARRLNVAFSRARRLLVIVGDRRIAGRNDRIARALELIPETCILPPGTLP